MCTDRHAPAVRRWAEDLWNQGRLEVAEEIAAPDFVFHLPGVPIEGQGPDVLRAVVRLFRGAFPDLHFTMEDQIVAEDAVVIRWTARGTHRGELFGIAPTGRTVTVTGVDLLHFVDGRLRENWVEFDALGLMLQLGAIPVLEAVPA
jgi:steroid delta-isomerase-like uncharacterized protein